MESNSYHGENVSLHEEIVAKFSNNGSIYKYDNTLVYMKIYRAAKVTSVESTINTFYCHKDGRGAFLDLISNHADDTNYRVILKKRMNLLHNIQWNGSY